MMKNIFTRLFIGTMLILSMSAKAQDGLFISEIADPADDYTGRFIELFNGGPDAINFSADTIYLSRQSNGGTGWGDVQLTGTVASGETFVVGGSAFEGVYGFAPDQVSGIIIGNGDDAYFLYRDGNHLAGTLHDIFGAIDTDGTGELWEYEDSRAVRVEGLVSPNLIWGSAEWVITSANIADVDPGIHYDSTVVDTVSNDLKSLTVLNDTVNVGQSFEQSIAVNEITAADNIISYQFDVDFDPLVLEYTGSDITGTIADGGTLAVNTNVAGKLSIGYMNSVPVVGAGIILKLHFNALVADTTEILLSNAYLNNTPVQNLTNGSVIIKSLVPPTAAITYIDTNIRFADLLVLTATFSEIMDEANAVLLGLSGAVTVTGAEMIRQSPTVYTYNYQIPKADGDVIVRLSNGTDMWDNEVVSAPTSGDTFHIEKFTIGDVDDDGIILAYDAAITLQYSVGLDPLPAIDSIPWENWRDSTANVDGVGNITANDAGMILQYSAGIITSFSGQVKKSVSLADVSVHVENNEIVFYSHGELLGLNISTENENEQLGPPIVIKENFVPLNPTEFAQLNSSGLAPTSRIDLAYLSRLGLAHLSRSGFISAFNNKDKSYSFALCTAHSPEDGAAIMKIPYNKSGSVTFNILINTQERILTVDLTTGIVELLHEDISIYPNPTTHQLFISTGRYYKKEGYLLRIINQQGTTVYKTMLTEPHYEINLSDWPGAGLYYLHLTDTGGRRITTRKIILQ